MMWLTLSLIPGGSDNAAFAAKSSYFINNEVRSTNLKPFPKWNSVLQRYNEQMRVVRSTPCGRNPSHPCEVDRWQSFLGGLKGQSRREQVKQVNAYLNQRPYILDPDNWGKTDYWATPIEFLTRNGDCEDYAIAKFLSLLQLGVPNEDMRIVILQDFNLGGIMHAVLEVTVDGESLILDNQAQQVRSAEKIYHYKPIYSINQSAWWAHRY